MRVIAGKARSLKLKTPEGAHTRPTTDRIKETLFNMLQPHLPNSVFIDLFSGSGGIGIEALSRGAAHTYFVDNNKQAVDCITDNLKFTKLTDQATVLRQDVISALDSIHEKEADIIFMDPPYNAGYEKKVLQHLSCKTYVTDRTILIIEAELHTDFTYAEQLGYQIEKEKSYKSNKHIFLRKSF